jgi:hypothetical protein
MAVAGGSAARRVRIDMTNRIGGDGRFAGMEKIKRLPSSILILLIAAAFGAAIAVRWDELTGNEAPSDWVMAAVAVCALVVGYRQLDAIRVAEQASALQGRAAAEAQQLAAAQAEFNVATARATLLLRLDEQFESERILQSRKLWRETMASYPDEPTGMPDPAAWAPKHTAWVTAAHLEIADDVTAYRQIMMLPNWIETVGVICREDTGLLPFVERLHGGVIMAVMDRLEPFLVTKSGDLGTLENALWIRDQIRLIRAKKTAG